MRSGNREITLRRAGSMRLVLASPMPSSSKFYFHSFPSALTKIEIESFCKKPYWYKVQVQLSTSVPYYFIRKSTFSFWGMFSSSVAQSLSLGIGKLVICPRPATWPSPLIPFLVYFHNVSQPVHTRSTQLIRGWGFLLWYDCTLYYSYSNIIKKWNESVFLKNR